MYGYVNRGDTTNICRRNKNFNLRDARVEHADRRKNSSSRIWSAGSEFLTGSSDFRPGHARLTRGHVRNFRRIPFSPRERLPFVHLFPRVSWSKEEGVEERESVACSTNFTNFRDGGGGFLHFRPANALVTSKSLIGTRQGRIGVEIGGGAIWESNSREMGRIFFSIVLSSGCNSYVVWFVTDASNTSLNGSQSQRVLTMPARLR